MLYTSAFQTPSFHVRRLPILAAVLAALFLVLAACGGDPEPTVPPTLTEESTSVAVAPASTPAPASPSSGSERSESSGTSVPSGTPVPGATAPASVSGSAPTPASAPVTPAVVPATPVPTEPAGPPGSPAMDRAALEAFYHALRGPAWDGKPSWGTDAPLGEWTGVSVDDGRVVGLRVGLGQGAPGQSAP